jgi:hypothetical protein
VVCCGSTPTPHEFFGPSPTSNSRLRCWSCCLPLLGQRQRPDCRFSKLDTQPIFSPVYASLDVSQRPVQNSGPSGLLLLSRKALSSSLPCRFNPALPSIRVAIHREGDGVGARSDAPGNRTEPYSAGSGVDLLAHSWWRRCRRDLGYETHDTGITNAEVGYHSGEIVSDIPDRLRNAGVCAA